MKDIVLVVSKCDFVTALFLCCLEECFTSVPRTKETRRFLLLSHDVRVTYEKRYTSILAEVLQVRQVGNVFALTYTDMDSSNTNRGFVDTLLSAEQLSKQETVFSSAQSDKDMVSVRQ
jgi:hypothetical protein